jgi:NADPH:quinone reductase-like Zn-dependent oxidoreductase
VKAVVLPAFGSPLELQTLPDPVLGTGEVIVDMVATRVLSYADKVFSGERSYVLDLPAVPGPGGIGRVRATGPDATHLRPGDWVYCDPTVRSRDDAVSPDILLQGWTAGTPGAVRLQQYYRHGSWAEQMLLPTENVKPLGQVDAADAGRWCALGTMLVPYGGFVAASLQAGETVLVSGATGNFGGAAVAVALAMGAACVVAAGRNERMLSELSRRSGARVRPVRLTGEEKTDTENMKQAAPGPIDCVLDILPREAGPTPARAAALTVRPYGRVVLMGGVGGPGEVDLPLPYRWIMRSCITIIGAWMYNPDAALRLAALIRAGLLQLDGTEVVEFGLSEANEAVAHAAANGGPFKLTVLRP